MLWTIVAILLIIWLAGLIFKLGGKFIHALLIIALIVVIIKLFF
jgi:hypothetical protein